MRASCGCAGKRCSTCYRLSCPCPTHQATKSLPHGQVDCTPATRVFTDHAYPVQHSKRVHPYPTTES